MSEEFDGSAVRTNIKIGGSTLLVPQGESEYKADKLFFSAIKEEEWLNLLASEGYALVGRKFTGYVFTPDKNAGKYYYSVCLLPAQAEADYAEHYMKEKSGHSAPPVCTFSNKAYYRTPTGTKDDGIVADAVLKLKHLRRAFAFHFGFLLFWLGLLCYNLAYWVRFDAAGATVGNKPAIWKFAPDLSRWLGDYPTTPYISLFIVAVILCVPFTVYYFDQYMYSRSFLKNAKSTWEEK